MCRVCRFTQDVNIVLWVELEDIHTWSRRFTHVHVFIPEVTTFRALWRLAPQSPRHFTFTFPPFHSHFLLLFSPGLLRHSRGHNRITFKFKTKHTCAPEGTAVWGQAILDFRMWHSPAGYYKWKQNAEFSSVVSQFSSICSIHIHV